MNAIRRVTKSDTFTSREFNRRLNETLEHGWNGKVTLDFLYVAESLGLVECLGFVEGNQYSWRIKNRDEGEAGKAFAPADERKEREGK